MSADVIAALAAAYGPPGSVATLILPADVSWSEGGLFHRQPDPTGLRGAGGGPGRAAGRSGGSRSSLGPSPPPS